MLCLFVWVVTVAVAVVVRLGVMMSPSNFSPSPPSTARLGGPMKPWTTWCSCKGGSKSSHSTRAGTSTSPERATQVGPEKYTQYS